MLVVQGEDVFDITLKVAGIALIIRMLYTFPSFGRERGVRDLSVVVVLSIIITIYLTSAFVLWLLSFIGPIHASLEGTIKRANGVIWFAAAGFLAAFIIIALLGLAAVYIFARAFPEKAFIYLMTIASFLQKMARGVGPEGF